MTYYDQNEDFSHTHNSDSKGEWLFCHFLNNASQRKTLITIVIRDFLSLS